jgi:hypothetical protein
VLAGRAGEGEKRLFVEGRKQPSAVKDSHYFERPRSSAHANDDPVTVKNALPNIFAALFGNDAARQLFFCHRLEKTHHALRKETSILLGITGDVAARFVEILGRL